MVERRHCPSCGTSFTQSKPDTGSRQSTEPGARDVANTNVPGAGEFKEDMRMDSLQEEDEVCQRCMQLISQSIESNNTTASTSSEAFYPGAAMTSSLPRSRSTWDEVLAREYQPFMPMAQNKPRLTLPEEETSWRQPGTSSTTGGSELTPSSRGETMRRRRSEMGDRSDIQTSHGNVRELLDSLNDTNDKDTTHFVPWLMARKRFSADALRDAHPDHTPPLRERNARVRRSDQASVNEAVWSDPYAPDLPRDVSFRRVRPVTWGCLHPGAVFVGTQRNGRSSYNVSVEITNVDMESSTLGGYLKICGLTKEWPEITTYFEAEIIGKEYSFVTGKWDATEADDIKHWSRFPEFGPLRDKLQNLRASYDAMAQPMVFMRWKERFLVPDHRVRNINGASFAGFYYMCVTLEEQVDGPPVYWMPRHDRTLSEDVEMRDNTPDTEHSMSSDTSGLQGSTRRVRRHGHMRGFYFHENSEPYQELSLEYQPSLSSGFFELR